MSQSRVYRIGKKLCFLLKTFYKKWKHDTNYSYIEWRQRVTADKLENVRITAGVITNETFHVKLSRASIGKLLIIRFTQLSSGLSIFRFFEELFCSNFLNTENSDKKYKVKGCAANSDDKNSRKPYKITRPCEWTIFYKRSSIVFK